MVHSSEIHKSSGWLHWQSRFGLIMWLLAGAVAFLPFAIGTSPWDAVRMHVPGNQGNWWHVLVGAPFFLAFPMIWLRLGALFSRRRSAGIGRSLIWGVVGLSILGTALVELPFLLHLAGTSEWQRFSILALGFGIIIVSGILLIRRRRFISPIAACMVGLNTAYLANVALCLVVYGGMSGNFRSRSGWFVSVVLVWPMLLELVSHFRQTNTAEA